MGNVETILKKIGDKENMPHPVQVQTYKDIMSLYDNTEAIIKLAQKHSSQADPYINHLQKLVDSVEKNLELMMNNFLKYVESGKGLSGVEKMKIEKASKEINIAIQQFLVKIKPN
jgi:ribosomal protein L1